MSNEEIDKEATRRMAGSFSNFASYYSRGQFMARRSLAEVLDVEVSNADRVRISSNLPETLEIAWIVDNEERAWRMFGRNSGLEIAADGSIVLPSKGESSAKDGVPAFSTFNVRMFINRNGDLATIQTGGGAVLFFLIPIGIYTRHLAIFPRR